MTSQQPPTDGTSADHSRSGADIAEAIEVAERGSSVEEVHDRGTEAKSGEAPVERSADDPEMTEGQVAYGSGDESADSDRGVPGPDGAEFRGGPVGRRARVPRTRWPPADGAGEPGPADRSAPQLHAHRRPGAVGSRRPRQQRLVASGVVRKRCSARAPAAARPRRGRWPTTGR